MKTAMKIIGKCAKVYGFATLLVWAFIGASHVFKHVKEYPEDNVLQADEAVLKEAWSNYFD